MNELQKHVEKLFEGRLMTAGTLELKKEIRAKLEARYEELLDAGNSEEEAIEGAKALVPELDDATVNAAYAAKDPVASAEELKQNRKNYIVAFATVVVVLLLIGGVAWALVSMGKGGERDLPAASSAGAGAVASTDRTSNGAGSSAELTSDALLQAIVQGDPATIAAYQGVDLADGDAVKSLVKELPMGRELVSDVSSNKQVGLVSLTVENVPGKLSDDAVECAAVYDAVAIMCASPDVKVVNVAVRDSDDGELETLALSRAVMEPLSAYGPYTAALLADAEGWSKVARECMDDAFVDRVTDVVDVD